MPNIPISSLSNVTPTGYTPNDLFVIVNYDFPSGTTKNTSLQDISNYVLSGFTGNTSATCISDLYVTNVYGCSPITINNDLILSYMISAGTNSDDILVRENTGYVKVIPVSGLPFSNVTGLTFNNSNFDLTVGSDNGSTFTQSLSILSSDMTVTGGTYNSGNGVATFTTNSGNTFNVSGFLTGYTDTNIYTVDGTIIGNRTVTLTGTSLSFINTNKSVEISSSLVDSALNVSGKTKTINFQMTSGATNNYILTSDASGNGSWQPQTYKTVHTHGFNSSAGTALNSTAGQRWITFGSLIMLGNGAAYTSDPTYAQAQRFAVVPKTGLIKSAKISWYITGGNTTQNQTVTFRNNTTSTTNTVTTLLQIGPSSGGQPKTFVVSGLNIPVTENDVVHTVIQSPTVISPATVLTGVYMTIDYIIE